MATTESVDAFIKEYGQLCRKYGLYIDITAADTLGIFSVDEPVLEKTLADWREENGR